MKKGKRIDRKRRRGSLQKLSKEETGRDDERGGGDWSDLPDLALYTILKKRTPMNSLSHLFSFAGVCRSWRSVALSAKSEFAGSHPPLLCMRFDLAFYHIKEEKFYRRRRHLGERGVVVGSSHGYLITCVDLFQLALLNPFTGVVQRNIVPALSDYTISAKLSSPPPAPFGRGGRRCMVMAVCTEHILCCPLGGSRWSSLSIYTGGDRRFVNSIVHTTFFQGKLYAITYDGYLVTWDPVRRKRSWTHVGDSIEKPALLSKPFYLTESGGELLFVGCTTMMIIPLSGWQRFVRHFVVQRFDFSMSKWVPLKDLGNRSLFVDLHGDVYSDDDPTRWGGMGNCIYYMDSDQKSLYVFYMEDKRVEDLLSTSSSLDMIWKSSGISFPTFVWVPPSLC